MSNLENFAAGDGVKLNYVAPTFKMLAIAETESTVQPFFDDTPSTTPNANLYS